MRRTAKTEVVRAPAYRYVLHSRGALSLFCEEMPAERLAQQHGTPLYVYSAEMIRARIAAFERAFESVPHTVCYSVKANSTLAILRLIAGAGCGFDVVSGGELRRVLRVQRAAASKVVFSGVGKTLPEMELALRAGILLFNVESAAELRVLAEAASRLKKTASVAIRVNPQVSAKTHPYISTGLHEHKFGVPFSEAKELYATAARGAYLQVRGVSVHIGSQITDASTFREALSRVAEFVKELRKRGHEIRYVDAGGGLGISYNGTHSDFSGEIQRYARAVLTPLSQLNVHVLLEPGRSIVGAAGILLTRVLYRKTNDHKRFLVVDAAMNDLLRPSLYGARHEIVPCNRKAPPRAAARPKMETTDVVGPVCESGDFIARDRKLPVVQEGELLAILDTGAYGSVLASNYNTRGRAAEVLVEGSRARIIRRRETGADLWKLESL